MSSAPSQPAYEPDRSGSTPIAPDVAKVVREIDRIRADKAGPEKAEPPAVLPESQETSSGHSRARAGQAAAEQIDRMRANKGWREKEVSISSLVSATGKTAERINRKLGRLIGLWEELVPEGLAFRSRLASLRGGVLQVEVDSSAVGYELDRLLRCGLEAELRARFSGTLTRVRLSVGELDRD